MPYRDLDGPSQGEVEAGVSERIESLVESQTQARLTRERRETRWRLAWRIAPWVVVAAAVPIYFLLPASVAGWALFVGAVAVLFGGVSALSSRISPTPGSGTAGPTGCGGV